LEEPEPKTQQDAAQAPAPMVPALALANLLAEICSKIYFIFMNQKVKQQQICTVNMTEIIG
jgi:hypothetical protein